MTRVNNQYDDLVLVMDVGNTSSECGIYKDNQLLDSWRFMTKTPRTSDEYAVVFRGFLKDANLKPNDIEGVIISSVVPNIMHSLVNGIKKLFRLQPMIVAPGIKTGLPIKLADSTEVGADRIIDAVAACDLEGNNIIVVDFGTATTFDYINKDGAMCAKVTCPGMQISADALFRNAAQLPNIEIIEPTSILGKDTVTSMQAGLFFGYLGLTENIIRQMKEEIGEEDIKVVATGGYGRMIYEASDLIDVYDPRLALKGLKLIYDKNTEHKRKQRTEV